MLIDREERIAQDRVARSKPGPVAKYARFGTRSLSLYRRSGRARSKSEFHWRLSRCAIAVLQPRGYARETRGCRAARICFVRVFSRNDSQGRMGHDDFFLFNNIDLIHFLHSSYIPSEIYRASRRCSASNAFRVPRRYVLNGTLSRE